LKIKALKLNLYPCPNCSGGFIEQVDISEWTQCLIVRLFEIQYYLNVPATNKIFLFRSQLLVNLVFSNPDLILKKEMQFSFKTKKMKGYSFIFFVLVMLFIINPFYFSCNPENHESGIRQPVDSVGFATTSSQMDTILSRIEREQGYFLRKTLTDAGISENDRWKTVICPHDDYTYVGYLYPAVLKNLKAKNVILFGVAHKARQLNIENQVIFDSYRYWKAPKGNVPVSSFREEMIKKLPRGMFQINDSMQRIEHSLEALVPFMQVYQPGLEIVPILVPYMNFEREDEISRELARAIFETAQKRNWKWGEDFAIAISSDAVHYGDEDWGGTNYAFFGTDTTGYWKATGHEWDIVKTLSGKLTADRVKKFTSLTVDSADYKKYIWTWCGRYSIPVGLLTSYYLTNLYKVNDLTGIPINHSSSIDHTQLRVDDIGMGVTAPANLHHWVGYSAIGYK
jgi:MEMO1 family protein